ncbi:hypothetical protein CSOJ01_09375 [Colletotrichum sojae]|uniref:TAM domain methyltransferase n=1 Tax=Colletotrichum sojae TaxID=2175907 RepID=A0A8H6J428_9PEZI|nr:hypothetical protein CSOJ01_09375 [Colletotrichum sojae]
MTRLKAIDWVSPTTDAIIFAAQLRSNYTDLQHNLFLLTFDNALGLAPPNKPNSKVNRVLDVGTGTGIWAVEFGEDHPEADVFILHVAILWDHCSQLTEHSVPPNVRFEIDDLEEEWTVSKPFDYIFSRMMNSSIKDWAAFMKQAYNHLEPGGYFELQEPDLVPLSDDGTLKPDSALMKCIDLIYDASVKLGRPYQEIPPLVKVMEEAGFVDVKLNVFKWPTNSWPREPKYKELGIWTNANNCRGFEGFCMAPFTRAHGWTKEEVHVFLVDVRKDISNPSIHAYWPIYSLYGRKPEEEASEEN